MKLLSALADALYPPDLVCPLCGREVQLTGEGVCADCLPLPRPAERFISSPPLDGLTAGLYYIGSIREAVKAFKYEKQVWRAGFLAENIHLAEDWTIDWIVPVPLHPLKKLLRTYNQSELLARKLALRYPLPLRPKALRRIRYTRSQARLEAEKRHENMIGAFRASPAVSGRSILLVDDVITTHATLAECAKALKAAGAFRVYAACACMAGQYHDQEDAF